MVEHTWPATAAAMGEVAGCFLRRDPRLLACEMAEGLLMELDTATAGRLLRPTCRRNSITAAATT